MNYHDRIMNMPIPDGPGGESVSTASSYCHGHRDARHAAAEIATEADTLIGDLVKALTELGDWLAYGLDKPDGAEPTADDIRRCQEVATKARAAIAKAKEKGFE